jgi:hypothetical protein
VSEEPQKQEQWHLKKEVNITHIFATIGLIISAFIYTSALDKRIQSNEITIAFSKEQRAEDYNRIEKKFDSIAKQLSDIQNSINNPDGNRK